MDGPGPHCSKRLFEWVACGVMLFTALASATAHDAVAPIERSPLTVLMAAGWTPFWLSVVMSTAGLTRFACLWFNGHWQPHGPRVRAMCALVGAWVWGQMTIALVAFGFGIGRVPFSLGVYLCLTVGEIVSCRRAALDVVTLFTSRRTHRAV